MHFKHLCTDLSVFLTQVDVFGFGAKSDWNWHHYFDRSLTHFNRGSHGGDFKNKTMNELILLNKISTHKRL